tara:strand:+ start:113 stop:775 length:663 start_codon:yes stop_codon:yes gene_type:complete
MKLKILMGVFVALFLIPSISAATLHGSIYDSDIEIVNGVVVTINTIPEQTAVASDGSYSFELSPGEYNIRFEYFENNELVYSSEEEVLIVEEGDYLMDVILLPTLNEELEDDNFDFINPYEELNLSWIVVLIALLVASYLLWKNFKKPKEKKTSLEEDEIKKVLEFIQNEGGRTTQKDIRKKLLFSEAKASLILTELEHDKKIRRIKKGRGNIITLNKKS